MECAALKLGQDVLSCGRLAKNGLNARPNPLDYYCERMLQELSHTIYLECIVHENVGAV